jgi:hypothetical protein
VDITRPAPTGTVYTNTSGCLRELVVRPAAHGSLLVIDRDATTLCDLRLVAHIPADEPPRNAVLLSRMYADERGARSCRRLNPEDLVRAPFEHAACPHGSHGAEDGGDLSLRRHGQLYRIRSSSARPGLPSLRWCQRPQAGDTRWAPVTLRVVLGALESYEPACSLTMGALVRNALDPSVSVTVLRRELARVQASAFVLNRGLREAILRSVARGETSMSEIAARCGMVKRDRRGLTTGDTTWLARRVGLAPEGGRQQPTRWVHSDVLAHIARRGLGVSPREVEL